MPFAKQQTDNKTVNLQAHDDGNEMIYLSVASSLAEMERETEWEWHREYLSTQVSATAGCDTASPISPSFLASPKNGQLPVSFSGYVVALYGRDERKGRPG